MSLDPRDILRPRPLADHQIAEPTPLGGTRTQRIQRLQIGLMGIGGMLLLLGLADAISNRAQMTEEASVPEAAPTVVASETDAPSDPLADAGVVPELPATPSPTPEGGAPAGSGGQVAPPASNAPLQ